MQKRKGDNAMLKFNPGKVPNGLILDTNVLVYLFDPERDEDELFRRLLGLLTNRWIKLIIPEQVKGEWNKHKEERNEQYLKDTRKSLQKHKDLASHFDQQQEKDDFLTRLEQLEIMAVRQYRYTHGLRARNLNDFIENKYYTDIPSRNSSIDNLIVNMSLERKAPFFTFNKESGSKKASKNEMADAIIFFTACDYAQKNEENFDHIYFITENSKDFSGGNGAELHDNLKGYAEKAGVQFNNNLRRVLDIIDPQKSLIFPEQKTVKDHLQSNNFTDCSNCKDEMHVNADCQTRTSSRYPEGEFILVCPHCGHEHPTGETYHHLYN